MNNNKPSKIKIVFHLALAIYMTGAFICSAHAQGQSNPAPRLPLDTKEENFPQNENRNISDDELHTQSVGIGLGETFLMGEFRDNGQDSITFDAFYNYIVSYSFDLLVNAHYAKHTYLDQYVVTEGAAVSLKGKLYQFDALSPFILGGLGFYYPKVKRYITTTTSGRKLSQSEGKLTFGTNLGAGVDLKLNNRFTVGVIGQYHNPFDIKQNEGPQVEGSYFKLLLTLMINL